ncbi:sensory neuron membrane protein 2, partial [Halyomorpha halys]|uniref:sensory neuron membrane protein 2 n=1 Tax=Halyomorpha halys TaxID=286706 RepID=UPI0034D23AE1
MKKWVNWSIFALVGLLLAVGTLLIHYFVLPIAIHYQVTKTLALENGTEAWDRFVNTPIPLILNVYFFTLDNPEAILRGETPKLSQVGPYVYREKWEKVDIRVDDEKDTISYRQKIDFVFDQELSGNLSDKDKVTMINPVIHV